MELHDFGYGAIRFNPKTGEMWVVVRGIWTKIEEAK